MLHGPCGIEIESSIGKRVGRHVEDAHDERALAETHLEMADLKSNVGRGIMQTAASRLELVG